MMFLILLFLVLLMIGCYFLWQRQGTLIQKIEEHLEGQSDRLSDQVTYLLEKSNKDQLINLHQLNSQTTDRLVELRKELYTTLSDLRTSINQSLEKNRDVADQRLKAIQDSNDQRLEAMRQTVEEKLEKTLQTRLQTSFETVSKQLESVNKGLGEMQNVARDVGSLNKVLSGTKTRGILGELQLAQIIEDIMIPSQYEREFVTVKGSDYRVEFAIKLPGQGVEDYVYLPIDSKFPLADYYRLEEAYEQDNKLQIDQARKSLLASIKGFAKGIKQKYLNPPETTQFAILFLPTEGLYSEVVRQPEFFDGLRRSENILVAGPSTLSALLNSLYVGFKTLKIQKSANDISKVLGNVKTEFGKFGGMLEKTQTQLNYASKNIDNLLTTRTNAIERVLRNIEHYEDEQTKSLLNLPEIEDQDEN